MKHTARVIVAVLVSTVILGVTVLFSSSGSSETRKPSKKSLTQPVILVTPTMVDFDEQYYIEQEQQAIAAYLEAVHQQQLVDEYLAAVQAEKERQAALAASARSAPVQRSAPAATVGDCTGFAIPDYIIQRESGGNPSAYNPSGAYGCAQTLLSHYAKGGACQSVDPYTIEGQRACVLILSNGGTNLNPWALTR